MSIENSIEKAQSLYDLNQYEASFNMALAMLKEENDQKSELFTLVSKAFLKSLKTPLNEELNDTLYTAVQNACHFASDIEEVWNIHKDIFSTFVSWKRDNIQLQLENLKKNPTLDNYTAYSNIYVGYAYMNINLQIKINNCPIVNSYCEENGIEKNEYAEKYAPKIPDGISDYEIKLLEFSTTKDIFTGAQSKLESYGDVHVDAVLNIAGTILLELLTADCLIKGTLTVKGISDDDKCERLKLQAEIQSFMLSAMIYANGQPTSIFLGNREDYFNELKNAYETISQLDPDFEAPPLPDITPVKLPQSGGCYIATAVYGSYDCPEVWTLRRFRDNNLATTWYGRAFIHTYYAISPTLVKLFGEKNWFKNIWRDKLDRMVAQLNEQGFESTPYHDKKW